MISGNNTITYTIDDETPHCSCCDRLMDSNGCCAIYNIPTSCMYECEFYQRTIKKVVN